MGLPDKIAINAFREQEMITLPFDADAYALTMDWISETIARILTEEAWPHKEKPDYFCSYICSVYDSCPLVGY